MIKEINNNRKKILILSSFAICFIMITIGATLIFSYNKSNNQLSEIDQISLDSFFNKDTQNSVDETENNEKIIDYMAVIEIPKIGLKQGIPYMNSKDNNVDRNIIVVDGSVTPDVEKGTFILASHSGNSYISYFKHLYKLKNNDEIYIYYQNYKYVYTVEDISVIEKTGSMTVKRDITRNTLILVTCTNNSDSEQSVYTAYLKEKEAM